MGSWQRLLTAPGALLLGGLTLWAMAWALDFWVHFQVVSANPGSHTHGGGAQILRINFPLSGFPLIVFGMWQLLGSENLAKRPVFLAFLGGVLMALDGLAHAFAFNDHMNEYSAPFFAVIAPAQIGIGVALPFLPRKYDGLWLMGTLVLVGAYGASRTLSIPALGFPEPVEALGVFSKVVEVGFIVVTLVNLRGSAAKAPARVPVERVQAPPVD